MRFEEALADCLAGLDSGEDIEAVLRRYPEAAEELRDQIQIVRGLQTLSTSVPVRAGSQERARIRMQTALREAGRDRGRRRLPAALGSPGRFALAGAGLAVLAIASLLLFSVADVPRPVRSLVGSSSAEAATLEGVVVDNSNGVLTIQTASHLEKVNVAPNTPIADAGGAKTALADVVAGEIVTIKGKRLGNGSIAAARIDRKTLVGLKAWCDAGNDQCQQLKERLETLVSQCQPQNKATCAALGARLTDLREKLDVAATRLRDLQERCRSGGQLACRELGRFCAQHKKLCQPQEQQQQPKPATTPLRKQQS